jgi:hypothetical protein
MRLAGVSAPYDKDIHLYGAIGSKKVWNVNPLAGTGSDNVDFLPKQGAPLSDEALEGPHSAPHFVQLHTTLLTPIDLQIISGYVWIDSRYRAAARSNREQLAAQTAADREVRLREIQALPLVDQATAMAELDRTCSSYSS